MKRLAVLCDIDGTLAIRQGRGPYDVEVVEDAPRPGMARLLHCLRTDYYIVYVSGRQEFLAPATAYWLKQHEFPEGSDMFFRADRDNRADYVVKQEILQQKILPKYEVAFVLDDRNQVVKMWRDLGLLCLQVVDGDF